MVSWSISEEVAGCWSGGLAEMDREWRLGSGGRGVEGWSQARVFVMITSYIS